MDYSGSARRRLPMPWEETSAMEQRIQLIADWLSGDYSKSELCRGYGISRPTVDKWIERYGGRGVQGLEELSRAPHTHPNETPEELRAMIVETKLSHEALGRKTPGSVYRSSPRPYPVKLPEIEYESGVTVRQVRHNGEIKWQGEFLYVSEVLAKEPLGLMPIDEEKWELRYSFHLLGITRYT
jgi:transposase-like protein